MEIFKRTPSLVKLDEFLLMIRPIEMRLIVEGLEAVEESCRKDARNTTDKEDQEDILKQADMANSMVLKIKDALDYGHRLQN